MPVAVACVGSPYRERFELKNQIEGSGEIAGWERDVTSRGFYGHRVKLDLWERSSGVASQG